MKMVTVQRKVTITLKLPVTSYQHGDGNEGPQMTDDEIRDYEMDKPLGDQLQEIAEAFSFLKEKDIDFACVVRFEEEPTEPIVEELIVKQEGPLIRGPWGGDLST
jgi:hypothetical protein